MSNNTTKRLSREEIAKLEIGHTEVALSQQWALLLFFIIFISVYPICQFIADPPVRHWSNAGDIQKSIKAYETAIEDTSLLRRFLLEPAQRFLVKVLHSGNEKVIIGKDKWLFFAGDYEYLLNPGFMKADFQRKRALKGVQPDAVKAILDFNSQLQKRGIKLIVLPVPSKPVIYSDKLGAKSYPQQNPSFDTFKSALAEAGVMVIDLTDDFAAMRRCNQEPYLKTDTHWTPEGMELAAGKLAAAIQKNTPQESAAAGKSSQVTALGDIAVMLNLGDCEKFFPAETVAVKDYKSSMQSSSQVLLLGDSFANIYSLQAMKWGENGGLAEALSMYLNSPVDRILRNDAGAFATRNLLSSELKRGRDRLAGKKFVVYEFAMRELANGDWKMLDMTLAPKPETKFLTIDKSQVVSGTVLAVTAVPRPNSAPYKDHVMSIHLGDVNGTCDEMLIYAVSMRDNVWSNAARLRVGDSVKLQLQPWSEAEKLYGGWNRSEFEDEELLLAEPAFGELSK